MTKTISYLAILIAILGFSSPSFSDELDIRELPCFWFGTPSDELKAKYLQREREFSNYSWVYSILSANSYLKKSEGNVIPLPENFKWKELGSVEDEDLDQGFYARAWIKEANNTSELVISFRGTDSVWKDFYNGNFALIPYLFGRTQFDSAISFTNSVIEESGEKNIAYDRIIFTGHSLGGGLAQYAQRFYKGSQAIVFDPSPNKGRVYSLFSKKYEENAVRVYENGEILEYPRKLIDADLEWDWKPGKTGKSTIWMDFYVDGALDGHSIDDLSMSLVRVASSTGDQGALSVIKQIESSTQELPELVCKDNIYRKKLRNPGSLTAMTDQ